ncbi:MAG: hypothetical protein IJE08_07275 [Clostridia bacterium]|nr:hypothetical protein [Clostridia bacterium]
MNSDGGRVLMDWLLVEGMQEGTYEHLWPVAFLHTVGGGTRRESTDEYHYDKWGVMRAGLNNGVPTFRRDSSPPYFALLDSKRRLIRMTKWVKWVGYWADDESTFQHREMIGRLTVKYVRKDGVECAECFTEKFYTLKNVERLRQGKNPKPFQRRRPQADGMKVDFCGETVDLLRETKKMELIEGMTSVLPLRIWLYRGNETREERLDQLRDEMNSSKWYDPCGHLKIAIQEGRTDRFEVIRAPEEIRKRFWLLSADNEQPEACPEEPTEIEKPAGSEETEQAGRDCHGVFRYDWKNAAKKPDCNLYYGATDSCSGEYMRKDVLL